MIRNLPLYMLLTAIGLAGCNPPVEVNVPAPPPVAQPMPGPAGPAGATGAAGIPGATGKTGDSTTVIVVAPPASAPTN